MRIKSWRCDMPSCRALAFDTEDGIRSHQAEHLSKLCKQWEIDSSCPWPICRSHASNVTFMSLTTFRKHFQQTHLKSKWCHLAGCKIDKPFGTQHDLRRHIRTAHDYDNTFCCPLESCSQSFSRQDKLDNHVAKAHNTCKCQFDHCGSVILDAQATKNDHSTTFHQERPTFECALKGCESTISRFNRKGAERHLVSHHRVTSSWGSARKFLRRVEKMERGDIKIITAGARYTNQCIRLCKICSQKADPSDSGPLASGESAGARMVSNETTLA